MKGRMEINELQCLDAINNARCDNSDTVAWGGKCLQFLYIAHQADGAACLADVECTSGYLPARRQRRRHPRAGDRLPGTCANPKATGAPAASTATARRTRRAADLGDGVACTKLAALNEACRSNPSRPSSDPTKLRCQFGLVLPDVPGGGAGDLRGAVDADGARRRLRPVPGRRRADGGVRHRHVLPGAVHGRRCVHRAADRLPDVIGVVLRHRRRHLHDPSAASARRSCVGRRLRPEQRGRLQLRRQPVRRRHATATSSARRRARPARRSARPTATAMRLGGTISTCKVGFYCDAGDAQVRGLAGDGDGVRRQLRSCAVVPRRARTCASPTTPTPAPAPTCQAAKNFGAACDPGFEDSLCAAVGHTSARRSCARDRRAAGHLRAELLLTVRTLGARAPALPTPSSLPSPPRPPATPP